MWWFRIEFILYHAYILIFTFLPYGYLYLIVQTVGRALRAECSSSIQEPNGSNNQTHPKFMGLIVKFD